MPTSGGQPVGASGRSSRGRQLGPRGAARLDTHSNRTSQFRAQRSGHAPCGLVFLGAPARFSILTTPLGSGAQTHDAPAGRRASAAHDHSGASGAGGATPHGGMQHGGGESAAEMMWSMYTDLGNSRYQHGLYGEAEKTLKSALKEARSFGPDGPAPRLSLNNLAEVYRMEGRFADAEQSAREGLALRESAFGPNDASVADSLNTLALARHAQGHPAEAEALYRRALGIWEQTLGAESRPGRRGPNNLAIALRDQKQLDAAARAPAALPRDPRDDQRPRSPRRGAGAGIPGRDRARARPLRGGGDGEPPGGGDHRGAGGPGASGRGAPARRAGRWLPRAGSARQGGAALSARARDLRAIAPAGITRWS